MIENAGLEDAGAPGTGDGWFDVFPDPLGWALAVARPPAGGDGPGRLVLLAHLDSESQALALRLRDHPGAVHAPDEPPLPALRHQLDDYFAGRRRAFDLPLEPEGTDFQRRVWAALRRIPYGETRTYGEIAAALGQPGASRAVGQANGRNPLGVIVPCHRVVAAGGGLGGYTGGLHRKRRLLEVEGRREG